MYNLIISKNEMVPYKTKNEKVIEWTSKNKINKKIYILTFELKGNSFSYLIKKASLKAVKKCFLKLASEFNDTKIDKIEFEETKETREIKGEIVLNKSMFSNHYNQGKKEIKFKIELEG